MKIAQRLYPQSNFSVISQAHRLRLPVYEFNRVNAPEVLSVVNTLEPDLLVSVSCPQLIGRKLLNSVKINSLNIHSSRLPSYAGLAPYFWVLSRGETETAVTVHYMTTEFDRGNILVQNRIQIKKDESAFRLFLRLALAGSGALKEAVDLAL
jgi:methionyl-tRNA formyltransferase